jgi:hypothetical protein
MSENRFPKLVLLCAALVLFGSLMQAAAQNRTRRNKSKPTPAAEPTGDETSQSAESQVRLKLSNGKRLVVDDAWESEQGFWYRQGGMTYLITRDRATGIERVSVEPSKPEPQVAKVTEIIEPPSNPADGPAWIYLVGGARVEADSATESTSGVWYRRGTLSVFIDRARVDRIEREDPEKIAQDGSGRKALGWSTGSKRLDALIRQNGSRHSVDPYLIFLVMEQESHFNSRVVSPKGAQGLMQLMPGTGARFGVRRPFDPAQNISGGTRFLRQLLNRFNGRVDLVLASYNAGEGAVIKYGHKVPPYRETRNYVRNISKRYRRSKPPAKTTPSASSSGASGGN